MTMDGRRLRNPTRMSARVLVVTDQPALADLVSVALSHSQYSTRVSDTVKAATTALVDWLPHLVVLDMELEGSSMLEQVGQSTREGGRIPVFALTRSGNLKTKLTVFDQGADDILTIPFSVDELVARVLVIMRRTYQEAVAFSPVLHFGNLQIDILNRHVRVGATELKLTSIERHLLYLLACNAGRVVTRDEILDQI